MRRQLRIQDIDKLREIVHGMDVQHMEYEEVPTVQFHFEPERTFFEDISVIMWDTNKKLFWVVIIIIIFAALGRVAS